MRPLAETVEFAFDLGGLGHRREPLLACAIRSRPAPRFPRTTAVTIRQSSHRGAGWLCTHVCPISYRTMTALSLVIWLLVFTPITFGQPILRLSLKQAIEWPPPDVTRRSTGRHRPPSRRSAPGLCTIVAVSSDRDVGRRIELDAQPICRRIQLSPLGVPNFTIPAEVGRS